MWFSYDIPGEWTEEHSSLAGTQEDDGQWLPITCPWISFSGYGGNLYPVKVSSEPLTPGLLSLLREENTEVGLVAWPNVRGQHEILR